LQSSQYPYRGGRFSSPQSSVLSPQSKNTIYVLLVLFAAIACTALAAARVGSQGVFRDITRSSGIQFRLQSDLRRLKMIPTMNGGCAFGDYDGDGLPDLYVVNSVPRWGKPNTKNCGRLYRNLGGGKFEDATEKAGLHACGVGMGAFWVDLDGDGRLDLYLTNVGGNVVYWNNGDGTFEEGKNTGLEDPLFSIGAGFLDYDNDGRVDVVVANYLDSTPEWEAKQRQFELRVPEDYVGQPSHLFRNVGNRHFTDVTKQAGLAMDPRETKTLGVAVLDYDGDGRPDLYFVNDRVRNRLFHNRGDGTFEEVTDEMGAGTLGDHPRAGMGVSVGDPFGDGRPSLFVTNFGGEANSFYRNVGGALFEDAGAATGTAEVGFPYVRWGTHFADFDNDGWPDLYAVGGHLAPGIVRMIGHFKSGKAQYIAAGDHAFAQKTVLFHNTGHGRFEEWLDSGDLAKIRMAGRGSAVADIDNDGNLDLFVMDLAGPSRLFENVAGSRNSWIRIEPRVGADHRTVLGTKVRVTAAGHTQTKEFYVSPSYASGTLTDLHFGLGSAEKADRVEVTWPGGRVQVFENVAARKIYSLKPGEDLRAREPSDAVVSPR
jgi:enediyne biosynthesis protein E4